MMQVIQSIQPWGLRDKCHSYLEKVLPSLLPLDAFAGLNSNKVTVSNSNIYKRYLIIEYIVLVHSYIVF